MNKRSHILPSEKPRKRLSKVKVQTNPHYGKQPSSQTLSERLQECMILIDKPAGPTSHQVDAWVKNIFDTTKVGHAGTLDPRVTGVLPIGIGRATRGLQVLIHAGKEYVGVMKLHADVPKKKIQEIQSKLIGDIIQLPPVRSAVKRVKRKRQIYYFDIIEIEGRNVLFRVGCEAGTYIRTLCVDIGKKLGVGAHLAELRRTRVGNFSEESLVKLQDVLDAYIFYKEDGLDTPLFDLLYPFEALLDPLPKIIIRDSAVDAICHGADLALPGVAAVDSDIKKDDTVAVLTLKDEGVMIGKAMYTSEEIIEKDTGMCVKSERVFMKKGTYPSIWKKH